MQQTMGILNPKQSLPELSEVFTKLFSNASSQVRVNKKVNKPIKPVKKRSWNVLHSGCTAESCEKNVSRVLHSQYLVYCTCWCQIGRFLLFIFQMCVVMFFCSCLYLWMSLLVWLWLMLNSWCSLGNCRLWLRSISHSCENHRQV